MRDPTEIPVERPEEHPKLKSVGAELAAILARISTAQQRRRVAQARQGGQQPTRPAAEQAQALLKGGQINFLSPGAELEAAEAELRILHAARLAKIAEREQLVGEIAIEIGKRFAPLLAEAHRNADAAAEWMFESLQVARIIHSRIIGAGYPNNESVLPTHTFEAAAQAGDPAAYGSPAARHREWCCAKGYL